MLLFCSHRPAYVGFLWHLYSSHRQSGEGGMMWQRAGESDKQTERQGAAECGHFTQSGHIPCLKHWDTVDRMLCICFSEKPQEKNGGNTKVFLHNDAGCLETIWTCVLKILKLGGKPWRTQRPRLFSQTHLGVITHQPQEHGWPSVAHCFSLHRLFLSVHPGTSLSILSIDRQNIHASIPALAG